MTTKELIAKLQEVDPTGERTVLFQDRNDGWAYDILVNDETAGCEAGVINEEGDDCVIVEAI